MEKKYVQVPIGQIRNAVVAPRHEQSTRRSRFELLRDKNIAGVLAAAAVVATSVYGIDRVFSDDNEKKEDRVNSVATSGAHNSTKKLSSANDFTPQRLQCEPVAEVAVNAKASIVWDIPNIPIAGSNDIPDLGRGTIGIESCVGNLVDNIDQDATKRTGTRTYTLTPNDIQFKLDTSEYKNGFPDYSTTEIAGALKDSNPSLGDDTLQSTADLLLRTVESQDDQRYAHNIQSVKSIIAERYGAKIVSAALGSAQDKFADMVKDAGLTSNQVALRPENPEGDTFTFIDDSSSEPTDTPSLFTYQTMVANTKISLRDSKKGN